jgi:hypothetical protein
LQAAAAITIAEDTVAAFDGTDESDTAKIVKTRQEIEAAMQVPDEAAEMAAINFDILRP